MKQTRRRLTLIFILRLMPKANSLSTIVTMFLDEQDHPLRKEIDTLRSIIVSADSKLEENIKWNGPNYSVGESDRITMKIHPPKQIQLIFHRGAKVLAQPKNTLIDDSSGLLDWKANDRAVMAFKTMEEVQSRKKQLTEIVRKWVEAAG